MKVLLCWPHTKAVEGSSDLIHGAAIRAGHTHHGFPHTIGYIGSYVDELNVCDVKCYDFSCHTFERVKETLLSELPDILYVECHTSHRAAAWEMAAAMKEIRPDCTVVMGGYHALYMWRQMLENFPAIDYCICGDEYNALRALIAGKGPGEVPNLAHRFDGDVILNAPSFLPMDEVPFIKYELFNHQDPELIDYFYGDGQDITRMRYHVLSGSLGCYANCNFCGDRNSWKRYRVKSAERMFAEAQYMIDRYGHPLYCFKYVDDVFAINSRRVQTFCDMLTSDNIGMGWACYVRADVSDPEVMETLRKAGLISIAVAVESGSQRILDNLDKEVLVDDIYDTFQYAHYYGIDTFARLIVGAVGESQETIDETKKLIRDLCPGNIGVSYRTVFPGTWLYRYCKSTDYMSDDYWLTDQLPPLYTRGSEIEQIRTWRDELYATWESLRITGLVGPQAELLPEYTTKMLPEFAHECYNSVALIPSKSVQLSGYTMVKDDDVAIPSIASLVDVCDEVVVMLNDAPQYMHDAIQRLATPSCPIRTVSTDDDVITIGETVLRNAAIDLCVGTWILELDSDEVLYEDQRSKIRALMKEAGDVTIVRFRCNQFCGDSHHLQCLKKRNGVIDPVVIERYGWGPHVINGYTNWNHIMMHVRYAGRHYVKHSDYKFGIHSNFTCKIGQDLDTTADWDVLYAHYSLIQSNRAIYRKFLRYSASRLGIPEESLVKVPFNQVPITEEEAVVWFGEHFDGEYLMIPNYFTSDPDNPLVYSRDFDVMTFHGDHPKYMKNSGLLGRRIETTFDDFGHEVILRKYDRDLALGTIRIGNAALCGRASDFRVFDMPVDYKRLLHSFNAIIAHDYYTFTAEAASINENTFMIARDPSVWNDNYREVVHECVRMVLTRIEYVPRLLELGMPLKKIVWHVNIDDTEAVKSFVSTFVGSY